MATKVLADHSAATANDFQLRGVLCGSFRRDPEGLKGAFSSLRREYAVLSPSSTEFVNPGDPFVRLADELDDSVAEVEGRHLDAIAQADFVWLHAPHGYVGLSASLEIGHARALGIPVFTSDAVTDATLSAFIQVVESPTEVSNVLRAEPGSGLTGLQSYYRRTAARRGWGGESARDTLLLITEEVGELARAVRKSEGLARDTGYAGVDAASELADVQLYLVHLANTLGVDLAMAVTDKERVNERRHNDRLNAA